MENHVAPGDSNSIIRLQLQHDGKEKTAAIKRLVSWQHFISQKNSAVASPYITDSILYLDMSQAIKIKRVPGYMKGIKAVILDLRNYPEWKNYKAFRLFAVRKINNIFSKEINYRQPGNFQFSKLDPINGYSNFNGQLIILTSCHTVSMGEYFTLLLDSGNPHSILVGDTTVGAIGQFTSIPLLRGWAIGYTGTGVYIDGKTFQQRGIPPDVLVLPTGADIVNRRDAVLEKALEIARSAPKH